MSGIPQVRKTGPRTYVPAELILGGQVVEARAAGRIGPAGAGSVKTLGVAVTDAINPEGIATEPTIANGRTVLNAAPLPTVVAVADSGIEVPVKYAAAAAFGDRLKAAAAGAVTPMLAEDDPRSYVGKCTQPAGVAAGSIGLVTTA
ncbi:hypothetical protein ACOACO_17480 [Nocardioides sp. CPCC 205120]|uniref:hypothetical protein n=1 Tax=Nocardioides sp. CPCC 205120 TaxID=3406462 RepID=UPI003B50AB80